MKAVASRVPPAPSSGFTLIEMAVVLAVLGIVLGAGMLGYAQYVQHQQVVETRKRMDTVLNVLSAYAQRHNRLPCPATPTSNGVEHFSAAGGTSCYDNSSATDLYRSTQGVLPWRTLGVPERLARDAWGRLITYKPAPQLTLDTYAAAMQDLDGSDDPVDIHNACRTLGWFSNDGSNPVHVNRAQALFCCNAGPKEDYLPGGAAPGWRSQSLRAAGEGTDESVIATPAWMDAPDDTNVNGSFNAPRHVTYGGQVLPLADSPLIRASTNAVTLISHGGNGALAYILGSGTRQQEDMEGLVSDIERDSALDYAGTAAAVYNPKLSGGAYDSSGRIAGASDDVVIFARSDQLYARAGKATCRPAVFEPACNMTNTSNTMKDVSYLVDTSISMQEGFTHCAPPADCSLSRIEHTKNAFRRVLPKHIDMEMEYDTDEKPDMVSINYFHNTGAANGGAAKKTADQLFGTLDGNGNRNKMIDRDNAVYDADGNLPLSEDGTDYLGDNQTVDTLFEEINSLKADDWTPLAQSLIDTAAAIAQAQTDEDGALNEPNTIMLISDGANNMRVTIPDGPDAGTYGTNNINSTDNWTPLQKATDYIKYKYGDKMRVFVIDVSGNTDPEYIAQMQRVASETGGQYRQALDPESLETIFDGVLSFVNEELCN